MREQCCAAANRRVMTYPAPPAKFITRCEIARIGSCKVAGVEAFADGFRASCDAFGFHTLANGFGLIAPETVAEIGNGNGCSAVQDLPGQP